MAANAELSTGGTPQPRLLPRLVWLALFAFSWTIDTGHCDPPPSSAEVADAQKLIDQLADPDFSLREQAEQKLRAMGPRIKKLLESTLTSSDIEQRLRAEQILRDIHRGELWHPSLVTMKVDKTSFLEVVRVVAEQTNNLVDWARTPKSLTRAIDVNWHNTPYWLALDEACRKADAVAHPYDDAANGGLVIRHGATGDFPVSYVGPLRLRVTQYQRNWTERLAFGDGNVDRQDAVSLDTALHWEQRFVLCRYGSRPRVLEALTNDGEDLAPKPQGYSGMIHISRRQRQLEFPVRLKAPTRPLNSLKRLRIALELVAAGEFETLAIEPIETGRRDERAGYIFDLVDVKKLRDRWEITVRWTRPAPYDKMNASDMADEYLEVIGANGEPMPFRQQRVYGDKSWAGYVLHVPFGTVNPRSLRARVALLKSPRSVEFSFANVPLGKQSPAP